MTKYKLGEIIELNPRESIKKGNIARKIAMDDLGEFKRDIESYSYSEYKGGTKFRNYDTLMARITPCLENGKTSFVNILEENEVAFGSTEYFVFRAKQDIINPYYLYYLVTTDKFREVAIKSMSGTSGRQRVQKDQILDFSVDLPSLEDQEKIMKPLKLIDDKISLNTKLNTNLLEFVTLIWKKYNSNTVNRVTLKKLANTIVTGKTPSTKIKENYGNDIPFVKIPDMHNKVFIDETSQSLTLQGANSQKNKYIPANSILVSCIGTPGLVSITDKNIQTNQQINSLILDEKYLYCTFIELRSNKDMIGNLGSGGTTIKNLNKTDFSNIVINIPNTDKLLEKFNSVARPIFNNIHENMIQTQKLKKIKATLLSEYF